MMKQYFGIINRTCFFVVLLFVMALKFQMLETVHADMEVRDQQHLLSRQQIDQIHAVNAALSQGKRPQQIWVRTYQGLPPQWSVLSGQKDPRKSDSAADFSYDEFDRLFPNSVDEPESSDYYDDEDYNHAEKVYQSAFKKRDDLQYQVSFLVIYQWHGRSYFNFIKCDEFRPTDFQSWYLSLLAPKKLTSGRRVMRWFNGMTTLLRKTAKSKASDQSAFTFYDLSEFFTLAWIIWVLMSAVRFAKKNSGNNSGGFSGGNSDYDNGYLDGMIDYGDDREDY